MHDFGSGDEFPPWSELWPQKPSHAVTKDTVWISQTPYQFHSQTITHKGCRNIIVIRSRGILNLIDLD